MKSLLLTMFLWCALRGGASPQAKPWPLQFHSILVQTFQGKLTLIDLWYDWPKGRNFNILQEQLGSVTYDLEWTNGTSFVYHLDQERCWTAQLPVGILRPNWMDGAEYLGVEEVNGFKCNFWQKVDFITYWEDIETQRPVRWIFYTGRTLDVMTFEVGATLEDSKWQAPVYCFKNASSTVSTPLEKPTEVERWFLSLQSATK